MATDRDVPIDQRDPRAPWEALLEALEYLPDPLDHPSIRKMVGVVIEHIDAGTTPSGLLLFGHGLTGDARSALAEPGVGFRDPDQKWPER